MDVSGSSLKVRSFCFISISEREFIGCDISSKKFIELSSAYADDINVTSKNIWQDCSRHLSKYWCVRR